MRMESNEGKNIKFHRIWWKGEKWKFHNSTRLVPSCRRILVCCHHLVISIAQRDLCSTSWQTSSRCVVGEPSNGCVSLVKKPSKSIMCKLHCKDSLIRWRLSTMEMPSAIELLNYWTCALRTSNTQRPPLVWSRNELFSQLAFTWSLKLRSNLWKSSPVLVQ